ncbi:MAG: chemotaxis protein CheW [Cyanobacteriota bacterium]|nr:chemotaxis protein CheW [Cyanobacteriota bacterium]
MVEMILPEQTQTQSYLSLSLAGERQVVLPLDQLLEVLTLPLHQIVPLPGMPAAVMGIINWRGEVLWLLDLGLLLAATPLDPISSGQPAYPVVILKVGEQRLGVVIEQVGQIVHWDPAQLIPAPNQAFLQGYGLDAHGKRFDVLDISGFWRQLNPAAG